MSGDGPDEFQTVQKRREGLFDGLKGARAEVTELTVQSLEELDKVLSLGVELSELLEGLFKVV